MTDFDHSASATQDALRTVVENGADQTALSTLADSEVLVPAAADGEGPGPAALTLPVFEQQDGTSLVPVFTSSARLAEAMPQTRRHHTVRLGALAHGWPSDELSLVIDAGSPEQLALTAQGVRALLDRDDDA